MFVSGETCKPRERGRESEKRLEAGGDRNKGWLEDSLDPITGALSLVVKMYTHCRQENVRRQDGPSQLHGHHKGYRD